VAKAMAATNDTRVLPHDSDLLFKRPRVSALIDSALQNRVVAVIASSGWGKTCSVSAYLHEYDKKAIWLQLSASDNMPSVFWEHFTSAIAAMNPEFALKISAAGFPFTFGRRLLLEELIEDTTRPRLKYILVIDDLHKITNEEVLWFIKRIGEAPPSHVSLVVLTRECNYPGAEWLLTFPDMGRIDAEDLRFTKNEMIDYYEEKGISISPDEISRIFEEAKGWPWLTSLAARLATEHPDDIEYVSTAMKQTIANIIKGQLIDEITPEQRRMLIKLSLIGHLSVDLVSQIEGGLETLREVSRRHTLVRFDARMLAYRIHDSLREYLNKEQGELSNEERYGLLKIAAEWSLAHDRKMIALFYYEQMNDYKSIVDLCYTMPVAIHFDMAENLLRIFNEMPPEALDQIPSTRVVHTRILLSLGRLKEAGVLLRSYIADLESRPPSPAISRILLGLNNNLGFLGMMVPSTTHSYDFDVFFAKADSYLESSGFIARGPITNGPVGSYACIVTDHAEGEPDKYIDAMARSIPHAVRTMNGCLYGLDDLARAELAYFRCAMPECERFALQALAKARERGQYAIENRALLYLLSYYLQAGKYAKIKEVLQQIEEQEDSSDSLSSQALRESMTSWYYATIGEKDKVANWLKSTLTTGRAESYVTGVEEFARINYQLLEKNYFGLLALVDSMPENFGVKKYLLGQIFVLIVKAVCHYNLKDKDLAFAELKAAWELSSPNNLDMGYIELGNNMRSLAGAALKVDCGIPTEWLEMIRSKSTSYAKRISYIRSQYREENNQRCEVALTPRELEVLEDLSHGLSRSEIAIARDISINTVKVMMQIIYEKLGAENNIDAIRIALKSGLLEE
jgi:LuxR family maltose regulon positive regulatory protein